MNPNERYFSRYVLSFIIATSLFLIIFYVANSFSYVSYERNTKDHQIITNYISELDNYLKNQTCSTNYLFDASSKLDTVGQRIDLLEKRLGKSNLRVLEQKKDYSELEYAHFRIIQRLIEDCKADFLTLLYFYTQEKDESDDNEKTAFILNAFKAEDSDHIMVYSFDASLDSGFIKNLRTWYNITTTPAVVVNGRDIFKVTHITQLDPYLEKN
ncbi:MAG: hypothetical protein AABY00_04010 [Nanoarchaeota archaeon]